MLADNTKNLAIIYHSQNGDTEKLVHSIVDGINLQTFPGLTVFIEDSITVPPTTVLEADAIILGTSENFGYMSGALKHFFDRIYYPCLEKKQGLPYQLIVKANNDGQGAIASVEKIMLGLAWSRIAEPHIFAGPVTKDDIAKCREFGATVAIGLETGIF